MDFYKPGYVGSNGWQVPLCKQESINPAIIRRQQIQRKAQEKKRIQFYGYIKTKINGYHLYQRSCSKQQSGHPGTFEQD